MRSLWLLIGTLVGVVAVGAPPSVRGGDIDNGNNRAWEVTYADGHGNRGHAGKPDYDALRLVIKKDSGKLIGDMWLYEMKNAPGGKKYEPMFGGRIALKQVKVKGGSGKHKRQEALFEGEVQNDDGTMQTVHVAVVLHTMKGAVSSGRSLDRLTVRVKYPLGVFAAPTPAKDNKAQSCEDPADGGAAPREAAPAPVDPCDTVPDMDILEESTVPDPAVPPDMPPP